jgi:exonuclease SbcC
MDFERFMGSIMLAQGGFSAFLQASADQRAPILEEITGTGIYTDISIAVHLRKTKEKHTLDVLEAETGGIVLLSDEEIASFRKDFSENQALKTGLLKEKDICERSIQWLNDKLKINQQLAALTKDEDHLAAEEKAFAPSIDKLALAVKAFELEPQYKELKSLKRRGDEYLKSRQENEDAVKLAEVKLNAARITLDASEKTLLQSKKNLETEGAIILKVRDLDRTITEKSKVEASSRSELLKIEKELTQRRAVQEKQQKEHGDCEKAVKDITDWLNDNKADGALVSDLSVIENLARSVEENSKEVKAKQVSKDKTEIAIAVSGDLLKKLTEVMTESDEALKKLKEESLHAEDSSKKHLKDKLLREYRSEQQNLLKELALRERIATLEDDRKKLVPGLECPLCGSKDHPFADGEVPLIDETNKAINDLSTFIERAEELETKIKECNLKIEKKKDSHQKAVLKHREEALKKESLERELKTIEEDLASLMNKGSKISGELKTYLTKAGISSEYGNLQDSIVILKERLVKWNKSQEEKIALDKKVVSLASSLEGLKAVISENEKALEGARKNVGGLTSDLKDLQQNRSDLYGHKNCDSEEKKFRYELEKSEALLKAACNDKEETGKAVAKIKAILESLKSSIKKNEDELAKAQTDFNESLHKAGFESEQSFEVSRLEKEERDDLKSRSEALKERAVALKATRKASELSLYELQQMNLTESPLEDLTALKIVLTDKITAIEEKAGSIKTSLDSDEKSRKLLKEKEAAIVLQKKESVKWDKLHQLIGSADGKKFRNFAQGLTFEVMVSHANQQLSKMNDRYLLMRREDEPLELDVIDQVQGGEVRSTANLSGGESFIVSLALALGLSRMASRKVSVDSLFLDEGFGTLDEEALETALVSLGSLHQSGKLIGVISHVPALKERIATQIAVQSLGGGKSTISGPGCECIGKDTTT